MITGRRIVVFGGSGFIGRYVVKRLTGQGWVVRVAVRDPVAAAFLKPMGNVGQVVIMKADLSEEASVAAAIDGVEAAINLVGILYERGRQQFASVHDEGAARLARLAAASGVGRLIHVSAIGADADSPAIYARTKAAGEKAVRAAFPEATIVRPSVVFGPEDGFFNRFAAMAMFSPALPLIGGGQTRFQPVYVGDVAEAIVRTLDDPAAIGQTFELGGPRIYSFRQLMELLLAQIRRHRCLINLPFAVADIQAALLERLPVPPLTRDQVRLLRRDNVVSPGAKGLGDLGIVPTAVETVIPSYLEIYRRGGRFRPAA
jgi:NADH dehydrogenase